MNRIEINQEPCGTVIRVEWLVPGWLLDDCLCTHPTVDFGYWCFSVCIGICIHRCMYLCVYVYVFACECVSVCCVCVYVCMCLRVYVFACVCVCVYVFAYTCIDVCVCMCLFVCTSSPLWQRSLMVGSSTQWPRPVSTSQPLFWKYIMIAQVFWKFEIKILKLEIRLNLTRYAFPMRPRPVWSTSRIFRLVALYCMISTR